MSTAIDAKSVALSTRLKRIAQPLQQAANYLMAVDVGDYQPHSANAKTQLDTIVSEVDLTGLTKLVEEHIHAHLKRDQETLKQYGIDK